MSAPGASGLASAERIGTSRGCGQPGGQLFPDAIHQRHRRKVIDDDGAVGGDHVRHLGG